MIYLLTYLHTSSMVASKALADSINSLADSTKGRVFMLQCCVRLSSVCNVMYCIVAKRCVLKQKLLLTD